MSKKIRNFVIITVSSLLSLVITANVSSYIAYSTMFKRVEPIDYSITPGLITTERTEKKVIRYEHSYMNQNKNPHMIALVKQK